MLGPSRPWPRPSFRTRTSRIGALACLAVVAVWATVRAGTEVTRPAPSASSAGPVALANAPLPAASGNAPVRAASPVAVAVRDGHAGFDIPMREPGSRTLVIVSSLADGPGPFPIRLSCRPTDRPRSPATSTATAPFPGPARREVRFKPVSPTPPPEVARRPPAAERTFHLMVRDGDVASASNYLEVRGRLRAFGERVQVYVDGQDLARVDGEVLRDLVATFDGRVFPTAASTFGHARDVDGDGRFTILLSSWLTRLAGGRHAVDGFVRGADFDVSLAAPFGNRCDMMYLSAALEPGPHLRTVLAHEYTHAVTLCSKAFAGPGGVDRGHVRRPLLEEEGWLDEATAHLVEDLHGYSRSNLDYRVSAFLSEPSRYRLVVEDYYAADLFRSHGNRGGTYLFLRWCADQFGPALLPTLIRSGARGTANLEAATGIPFAELYRGWSVALYLGGLGPATDLESAPPAGGFRSVDLRGTFGDWRLAGPRPLVISPGDRPEGWGWSATGTSSRFVVVESPVAGASASSVSIDVSGPPEAALQVTAVPLPSGMARVELGVRAVAGPDGVRRLHARLRELGGVPVRLDALAWEPLVPDANPRAAGFRRDGLDAPGIARAFGSATLPPSGTLRSRPIPLPPLDAADGPLVVKLVGTDAGGRRVAAWAEVPAVADVEIEDGSDAGNL